MSIKMVLTLQQQKFKVMLEEAITLICRSSLPYKCEASIDALMAITIDCNDVILISIKEKFDNTIPSVSSNMPLESDHFTEYSFNNAESEEQSFDVRNNDSDIRRGEELLGPKSKKRKTDSDKHIHNDDEINPTVVNEEGSHSDMSTFQKECENSKCILPVDSSNAVAESNLSNLTCLDMVEVKSEKSYDNFFNNFMTVPEESSRYKFTSKGCYVFEDYNSRANIRVEKFPMPKETSDMKPPCMTSLQVAMANEILSISGSFVNIGSAKAFQHNLRVLSKSELSEVVNSMSIPPSNPHSVGVLCTEGVSRVFYKIPPPLIKQEALDYFNLDFFSYNNLYHSAIRVPHNIRDPEEWKALVAMKNPFGEVSSSARSILDVDGVEQQN